MIYGDIPFDNDEEIVKCIIDFNKYNVKKPYKQPSHFQFNNNSNENSYSNWSNDVNHANNHHSDVNDLIKSCLNFNLEERIKLDNLLEHKWFNDVS